MRLVSSSLISVLLSSAVLTNCYYSHRETLLLAEATKRNRLGKQVLLVSGVVRRIFPILDKHKKAARRLQQKNERKSKFLFHKPLVLSFFVKRRFLPSRITSYLRPFMLRIAQGQAEKRCTLTGCDIFKVSFVVCRLK